MAIEEGASWIWPARGSIRYLVPWCGAATRRCYFLWRRELAAEDFKGFCSLSGSVSGLTQSMSKGLVVPRAPALMTRVSTLLKHLVNNMLGLADLRLVRGALTREDTALGKH